MMFKLMKRVTIFSGLFFFLSQESFARDPSLGQAAINVTMLMDIVNRFLIAGCFIFGVGFLVATVIKFKEHRKDPEQHPLINVVLLFIFGVAFVLIPFFLRLASVPIFGDDWMGR